MSGLVKYALLPRSFFGSLSEADRVLSQCVRGPEVPLAIFAFLAFLSS